MIFHRIFLALGQEFMCRIVVQSNASKGGVIFCYLYGPVLKKTSSDSAVHPSLADTQDQS